MELEDSGGIGHETIYGTHEDSHVVMSEKVQSLAGSIYQEFERMIARYDEDVVKTLMPLLVNVLECLDSAYQSNQEQDVELELLREDNEQLVTQYEREKGARKAAEQKLLEFEDSAEGERKDLSSRLESLESIVRMLELKHKNSMEHAGRLEEREQELKKEYSKLHDRYTELFKTHMDYMERTKLMLSSQQLVNERAEVGRINSNRLNIGRSSGPVSFGFASLEGAEDGVDSIPASPVSSTHSSPRDGIRTAEKSQETDSLNLENKSVVTSPISPTEPKLNNNTNKNFSGRVHTHKEQRSANTLYQELSFQDSDVLGDIDDGAENITGGWVHPGEYASSVNDNFFGMGKEVENLILENNELLATKNALNVVKDDLIAKVDELTGEVEMLREEIVSLNMSREKQRLRVNELEEELRKLKEANENKGETNDDESDVPMAQRKRFTRVEMARVLMERNQYKERFIELQEAVRWTEMIRASKNDSVLDKRSKQGIWRFFSKLFTSSDRPSRPYGSPQLRYQANTNQVAPGVARMAIAPRIGQDFLETELGQGSERVLARRAFERREQYRHVRAHVRKEDGRLQAYGWSLPSKGGAAGGTKALPTSSHNVPVPVPVYCRPLAESQPGMKIWCSAGVNLMGGYTKDGGLMIGGSVFYYDEPMAPTRNETNLSTEMESLDQELAANREAAVLETKLSSLVWICTSTHNASIVTVIDANNPAEILNSFGVCTNHLLCIASVPGASPDDYWIDSNEQYENQITVVTTTVTYSKTTADGEKNKNDGKDSNSKDVEETQREIPIGAKDTETNEKKEQQNDESNFGVTFVEYNETVYNKKLNRISNVADDENDEGAEIPNGVDNRSNENSPEKKSISSNNSGNNEQEKNNSDEDRNNREHRVMSSVLATMWLGAQNGMLYVHSSVTNWNQCLHSVKLDDSVISIVHVQGRVVVALANGKVAVFRRNAEGEWDLSRYHLVQLGPPQQSVRTLCVVGNKVWCGYRNKIHILHPRKLQVIHSFEAHPRKESQVKQLAWWGEGVWVSIRLDSTLRLYHAQTYQHLQDVDIEPYVSKMLGTGKLGFSFVRITSLLISSNRLWIGTGNGVIISVPINDAYSSGSNGVAGPGAIVQRVSGLPVPGSTVRLNPFNSSCVPYCTMAHAQLSFHGHRDSVKFFVAVPGTGGMSAASTPSEAHSAALSPMDGPSKSPTAMLVMSGGEGYIDFRLGDGEMEDSVIEQQPATIEDPEAPSQVEIKGEKSHLIVWQVSLN